jgi:tetratricopeptide (TPR) repeat protein
MAGKGGRQTPRNQQIFSISPAVVFLSLLLGTGCTSEQRVVDLYVDAVMLKELDQNEMAVERLESAIKIDKRFSPAYSLLGEIHQDMADYGQSAAYYEKAMELNPWSFKDAFNLGRVYEITKELALAVKAYVRACKVRPEHFDAHLSAAKIYHELKEYDSAIAYAQQAEQIEPNASEVPKLLGTAYSAMRDYEQAIHYYKRALGIDPKNIDAMTSLAAAYLKTGRNEPACGLLQLVTDIDPNYHIAYQYLGFCYLQLGQVDKAIESYKKALHVNEKDWQAARGLGVAYMIEALKSNDDMLKAKAVQQWRLSLEIKTDQPRREKLLELIRRYSHN